MGISETDLVTGERTSFFFANIGDILPFFTIKKWGFHGDSTNNFQVFISGFDDVQQNGGIHPEKKTDSAAIGFSKTSGKSGIENSDVPPMGDDFNVQDPMGKLTHLTHLTHCYPMVHTLV